MRFRGLCLTAAVAFSMLSLPLSANAAGREIRAKFSFDGLATCPPISNFPIHGEGTGVLSTDRSASLDVTTTVEGRVQYQAKLGGKPMEAPAGSASLHVVGRHTLARGQGLSEQSGHHHHDHQRQRLLDEDRSTAEAGQDAIHLLQRLRRFLLLASGLHAHGVRAVLGEAAALFAERAAAIDEAFASARRRRAGSGGGLCRALGPRPAGAVRPEHLAGIAGDLHASYRRWRGSRGRIPAGTPAPASRARHRARRCWQA